MGSMAATLLLLADGRFPAGGHSHSGGLEEAVAAGRVQDEESLFGFLSGRLSTAGLVDSALSAAAHLLAGRPADLEALDAEAAARCPSPALREASRSLGRRLARASASIWPEAWLTYAGLVGPWQQGAVKDAAAHGNSPMFPVVLGVVGRSVGLGAQDVSLLAAQASVSTPAWAATRLLGLDPFAVARCLAALAGRVEEVAAKGLEALGNDLELARLPSLSCPLLEIGAEAHARWEVRLFAS